MERPDIRELRIFGSGSYSYDCDTTDDKGLWGPCIGLKATLADNLTVIGELQHRTRTGALRNEDQDELKAFVCLKLAF